MRREYVMGGLGWSRICDGDGLLRGTGGGGTVGVGL